mmetsp:Transcript_21060/g.51158  ORF Transcript_21060/g.51158 Transcript_21060/m.51158 type:complete len:214 (+) Transcript_21060:358-999(+)
MFSWQSSPQPARTHRCRPLCPARPRRGPPAPGGGGSELVVLGDNLLVHVRKHVLRHVPRPQLRVVLSVVDPAVEQVLRVVCVRVVDLPAPVLQHGHLHQLIVPLKVKLDLTGYPIRPHVAEMPPVGRHAKDDPLFPKVSEGAKPQRPHPQAVLQSVHKGLHVASGNHKVLQKDLALVKHGGEGACHLVHPVAGEGEAKRPADRVRHLVGSHPE